MLYLISYDIPSSEAGQRRRNRVAKTLESVGLRVQYSVFEVVIDPTKLDGLLAALHDIIDLEEDNLRVYTCCASCAGQAMRLGANAPVEHADILVW